jgi:hypothetical protein
MANSSMVLAIKQQGSKWLVVSGFVIVLFSCLLRYRTMCDCPSGVPNNCFVRVTENLTLSPYELAFASILGSVFIVLGLLGQHVKGFYRNSSIFWSTLIAALLTNFVWILSGAISGICLSF